MQQRVVGKDQSEKEAKLCSLRENMEVHFEQRRKPPSVSTSRRISSSTGAEESDIFTDESKSVPGLHEWTAWRTKLNNVMVDLIEERHRIFSYPKSQQHMRQHTRIIKSLTEPRFSIGRSVSEFALSRAVHDYVHGEDGFHLEAESFLSFGIPRVKLRSNRSYTAESDTETLPFSPTSFRATNGSVSDDDGDKTKEFDVSSDNAVGEIIYSESTKKKNHDEDDLDMSVAL